MRKKFCGKCGAEIGENATFCPGCGAKQEEYAGDGAAKKAIKLDKKTLTIAAIAAAAVVVIAVVLGIVLAVTSGPKATAKDFTKAYLMADWKKAASMLPYDFEDYMMDDYGYEADEKKDFYEELSDDWDTEIDSMNDYYKVYEEFIRDELFVEIYGEGYKLKITDVEVIDEGIDDDILDRYDSRDWRKLGFKVDDVKDMRVIEVSYEMIGEEETTEDYYTVVLVKIGLSWKVLDEMF